MVQLLVGSFLCCVCSWWRTLGSHTARTPAQCETKAHRATAGGCDSESHGSGSSRVPAGVV